jgi:hypothetical protein
LPGESEPLAGSYKILSLWQIQLLITFSTRAPVYFV